MREVGRCDESQHGVGYLIIVVNHHRQKGMGDIGLLTCQMPALTNIDNAKTLILQQYQLRLFKLFKLFSLQSSSTEYQNRATTMLKNQASIMEYQAKGQQTARCQTCQ